MKNMFQRILVIGSIFVILMPSAAFAVPKGTGIISPINPVIQPPPPPPPPTSIPHCRTSAPCTQP